MLKAASRVLAIATILIAFVGQTIAFNTSMPCENSSVLMSSDANAVIAHVESTQADVDDSEDCCGIDCCNIDCNCSSNTCSSFVYFTTEIDYASAVTLSNIIYQQQPEHLKFSPSLLFRHPIFIS